MTHRFRTAFKESGRRHPLKKQVLKYMNLLSQYEHVRNQIETYENLETISLDSVSAYKNLRNLDKILWDEIKDTKNWIVNYIPEKEKWFSLGDGLFVSIYNSLPSGISMEIETLQLDDEEILPKPTRRPSGLY